MRRRGCGSSSRRTRGADAGCAHSARQGADVQVLIHIRPVNAFAVGQQHPVRASGRRGGEQAREVSQRPDDVTAVGERHPKRVLVALHISGPRDDVASESTHAIPPAEEIHAPEQAELLPEAQAHATGRSSQCSPGRATNSPSHPGSRHAHAAARRARCCGKRNEKALSARRSAWGQYAGPLVLARNQSQGAVIISLPTPLRDST